MTDMKQLPAGKKVAVRRESLGLTQYALARLVGIPQTHLRKIEEGQILSPSVKLAMAIAGALNTDVSELFGTGARRSA